MLKEEYWGHYQKAKIMPLSKLEDEIGKLYNRRFIEHDINSISIHRIYVRAYIARTRKDDGVVYKNYS